VPGAGFALTCPSQEGHESVSLSQSSATERAPGWFDQLTSGDGRRPLTATAPWSVSGSQAPRRKRTFERAVNVRVPHVGDAHERPARHDHWQPEAPSERQQRLTPLPPRARGSSEAHPPRAAVFSYYRRIPHERRPSTTFHGERPRLRITDVQRAQNSRLACGRDRLPAGRNHEGVTGPRSGVIAARRLLWIDWSSDARCSLRLRPVYSRAQGRHPHRQSRSALRASPYRAVE
jgi:hypothetical protein